MAEYIIGRDLEAVVSCVELDLGGKLFSIHFRLEDAYEQFFILLQLLKNFSMRIGQFNTHSSGPT